MSEIETFEILTKFREPLIADIIDSLNIKQNSRGIDIGCGIGRITNLLLKKTGAKIIGFDYSQELVNHAIRKIKQKNIEFIQGDVNHLQFAPHSFDWIWSMDTIWAGPAESGCPAEKPDEILDQCYRILKPGGEIYMSFWTAQKILSGYPLLEARLNASAAANAPYMENMDPYTHILNGKKWLEHAKFNVRVKTFAGDIVSPLSENDKQALAALFQMFWGHSKEEVAGKDWEQFEKLCLPDSDYFVLNVPGYTGFYTYTLFKGKK